MDVGRRGLEVPERGPPVRRVLPVAHARVWRRPVSPRVGVRVVVVQGLGLLVDARLPPTQSTTAIAESTTAIAESAPAVDRRAGRNGVHGLARWYESVARCFRAPPPQCCVLPGLRFFSGRQFRGSPGLLYRGGAVWSRNGGSGRRRCRCRRDGLPCFRVRVRLAPDGRTCM